MITALQHFISKKGKFVFILLLLLVVVSFVLYLSQGSSVFDLMSDGGREKKEFFGYDWNDPDQRRFLNVTTRAAGAVGAWLSPTQDVVAKADDSYMQGLQQQMQAAFRASPGEVDQDAMQRMFQYMQAWPNFSRDFKVREIARSGAYDNEFLEESIKTHVFAEAQADQWGFMSRDINHPGINAQFIRFLGSLDPSLISEENRTAVLSMVGTRFGMSGNELESVLYSNFRDVEVDRVYAGRGFALPLEVDVLSQQNAFAWDGEVAVLSSDMLPMNQLKWGELQFTAKPNTGDEVVARSGKETLSFVFVKDAGDSNDSRIVVPIGTDVKACAKNLATAIDQKSQSLFNSNSNRSNIRIFLNQDKLPQKAPVFSTTSKSIRIVRELEPKLREFFEENKDLAVFMKEPRTFATALVFESQNFMTTPPPAEESRLRSYFERNRIDFIPSVDDAKDGTEENSSVDQVDFNDVVEEVRKKVQDQDLADAKREADRLAQKSALRFLDQLNTDSDKLQKKFPDFQKFRNSEDFQNLLNSSGAVLRKISFSASDMNVQTMVLGLEKRASEQRSGKNPLEEVDSLDERKFFTRSVRKSRNGHTVFILDRKTPSSFSGFSELDYGLVCSEYLRDLKVSQFNLKVDEIKKKLAAQESFTDPALKRYSFDAKNERSARALFDAKQRSLRAKIDQIQEGEREPNGDDPKLSKKAQGKIDQLNKELEDSRKESEAVREILQGADSLAVNDGWVELKRTEDQALIGLITEVYSTRGKDLEADQRTSLQSNLEFTRAMISRDEVYRELISSKLSK